MRPSEARRDKTRLAYVTSAHFDESGNGGESGLLILGGYIGRVGMWKQFSTDWQKVLDGNLDGLPAWPPAHAVNIENGRNGFDVLDKPQRQARLENLVNVVEKYRPVPLIQRIPLQEFNSMVVDAKTFYGIHETSRNWWEHAYSYAAARLFAWLYELGDQVKDVEELSDVTSEVVFDTMENLDSKVAAVIESGIRGWYKESETVEVYERVGAPRWRPVHKLRDYIPVQAADLLVWHDSRVKNHKDNSRLETLARLFRDRRAQVLPWNARHALNWIETHTLQDSQAAILREDARRRWRRPYEGTGPNP